MALTPLASSADLATLMGRTFDSTESAQAGRLLESASAHIRTYTRRSFATPPVEGTITLDGGPERPLRIPGDPVVSVDTVTIDGDPVDDWELRGGTLYRAVGWSGSLWLPSSVVVTLTRGYAEVPADVESVALGMAKRAFDNTVALQALQVGDEREEYAASVVDAREGVYLSREDKHALSHYRRRFVSVRTVRG